MKLCPKCRGKIVPIVYGMPAPETFEKAERKEVNTHLPLGSALITEPQKNFMFNITIPPENKKIFFFYFWHIPTPSHP